MAESEWLQTLIARRDQLKEALASGTQAVSYGDYHKTFRSVDEIREAIADVEQDIQLAGGGPRVRRSYAFTTQKDL
jgi:hypothetical protein